MTGPTNEELMSLPEPHRNGESFVTVEQDVIAMQLTLPGARFLQRALAKRKIKAKVWQGWKVGDTSSGVTKEGE